MTRSEEFDLDYEALTQEGGVVALEGWATVTMTGADRHSFLHNMCTNDIRRLSTGEGCEAFCTDVKGKIVAHVFVLSRADRLELLMVPGQAEALISHLDRYIIREDVQLEDQSNKIDWHVASGAKSQAGLLGLSDDAVLECSKPWQHAEFKLDDIECLVASCDLFWPGAFLVGCSGHGKATMTERFQSAGLQSCTGDSLESLRVESRSPLFKLDFSEANLPQEIDRDQQAISFNKGCYLGQETIARIDALGHVNQKVVLLKFGGEEVPDVGIELNAEGKKVGHVTSSCWSPQAKSALSMALVRRGANKLGTLLQSDNGEATIIAPVTEKR